MIEAKINKLRMSLKIKELKSINIQTCQVRFQRTPYFKQKPH